MFKCYMSHICATIRRRNHPVSAAGFCSDMILCSFHQVLRISLLHHTLSFSGYTALVNFIHFFQMRKKPRNSSTHPTQSGIHFLTIGPFVLLEPGNGRKMKGKRDREDQEGERGKLPSKVAPVTALPRGPQKGIEERKERCVSVKGAGQRHKT